MASRQWNSKNQRFGGRLKHERIPVKNSDLSSKSLSSHGFRKSADIDSSFLPTYNSTICRHWPWIPLFVWYPLSKCSFHFEVRSFVRSSFLKKFWEFSLKIHLEFQLPCQFHLHNMGIRNKIEFKSRKKEFEISFSPHKVFFYIGEVLGKFESFMIGIWAVINCEGALMKLLWLLFQKR